MPSKCNDILDEQYNKAQLCNSVKWHTPHLIIVQARDTQNNQKLYFVATIILYKRPWEDACYIHFHDPDVHKIKYSNKMSKLKNRCGLLTTSITLCDTTGFVLWARNILYVPDIVYFPLCASPIYNPLFKSVCKQKHRALL